MTVERLPQELLISTLSYLTIKDIHKCSFLNKQWCNMIHDETSPSSQEIWQTLFQSQFTEEAILSERHPTWKQVYKVTTELHFLLPTLDHDNIFAAIKSNDDIVMENDNRTVTSENPNWRVFKTNKCIVLSEYSDRKFCFDVVLDEFDPEPESNYYSVVIGVYWTRSASEKKDPSTLLGDKKQEVGFRCGNRTLTISDVRYHCQGSTGDYTFPDKQHKLKSGDVVHVELILHQKAFDIEYYLNGTKIHLKNPKQAHKSLNIAAYSFVPCVSTIHHNKFTIRRSSPLKK
jgi:hypothetical protein